MITTFLEIRSRQERSQFFDANIGPDSGTLPEDDMYASYDKVSFTVLSYESF